MANDEIALLLTLSFLMGMAVGCGICGLLILGEWYFKQREKEKNDRS